MWKIQDRTHECTSDGLTGIGKQSKNLCTQWLDKHACCVDIGLKNVCKMYATYLAKCTCLDTRVATSLPMF